MARETHCRACDQVHDPLKPCPAKHLPLAQPGSASGLGPEGRVFKSCAADQPSRSSTVELTAHNGPALGSTPSGRSKQQRSVSFREINDACLAAGNITPEDHAAISKGIKTKFDRLKYQREYMREYRKRERAEADKRNMTLTEYRYLKSKGLLEQ